MNVTFSAPAIGRTQVPMGIVGPGEVSSGPEGVKLTGPMHSKTLASLLGCAGFIVGFVGAIALLIVLKLSVDNLAGKAVIAGGLGVMFGAVMLGRVLFPAKVTDVLVPWGKLKSLGVEGAEVTFVSKGKPSGQVWFKPEGLGGTPKALEELRAAAKAAGVTL